MVGERRAVDIVYLDFSKAVDTISHNILWKKPDGYIFHCVKNRLDGWAQKMVVNGVKFRWQLVTSGYSSGLGTGAINILMVEEEVELALGEFADDTKWNRSLICWRTGRLCRGIWNSWIDGWRQSVWCSTSVGSHLWVTTIPCSTTGWGQSNTGITRHINTDEYGFLNSKKYINSIYNICIDVDIWVLVYSLPPFKIKDFSGWKLSRNGTRKYRER